MQHREADGTWKTVGGVAESSIYQIILNLMEQVGAVEVDNNSRWKADFPAVPYEEDDDGYRVREVISDYVDYYGDGYLVGEGEGVTYTVRDNTYHVKTLLAPYDEDNSSHEAPSFTYRYHFNESTQKSDWEAVFDVSYGRQTGGDFIITNSERTHVVTFDSNGANEVASQVVAHGLQAQKPANPEKEGMVFLGWQQVINGQPDPHEFNFSTPITEDITLRAFFTDPSELGAQYFLAETREGAPEIGVTNEDDVVSSTLTLDDRSAGYGLGLVSSPYVEGEVPLADKSALAVCAKMLKAKAGVWFDVSLFKVQGYNWIEVTELSIPVELTLTVPKSLRKDGRIFYLLAVHNGVATKVAEGTGDKLKWSSKKFSTYLLAYSDEQVTSVKFVKNAKNAKGKMGKLSFAYGTAKKLTTNKFKRTGYTFAGWNTKADGTGKAYKNKASVKSLTAKKGGTVKLYAQWKAKN